MKNLFSLFLAFCSIALFATDIVFTDSNFKMALLAVTNLDANNDGEISMAEAENVEQLDLPNSSISDANELSFFINLEQLNLSNNLLTQLNLNGLTKLGVLHAENNQLNSFSVGSATTIAELHVHKNQLTTISLTALTQLVYLNASDNQLSTIDLNSNAKLSFLNLDNNPLTSLDVSAASDLLVLTVGNTQLDDSFFNSTSNPVALAANNLPANSVSLLNNTNLKFLNLSATGVDTLDLSANTALELIDLSDNQNWSGQQSFCEQVNLNFLFTNNSSISESFLIDLNAPAQAGNIFLKDSDALFRDCATLSIEEFNNELKLALYPNPASQEFSLTRENVRLVRVYDVSGKLLISSSSVPVNVESLNAGVYIVQVFEEGETVPQSFKLLKR